MVIEKIANLTLEKIAFTYLTSNVHFSPIGLQVNFLIPNWHCRYLLLAITVRNGRTHWSVFLEDPTGQHDCSPFISMTSGTTIFFHLSSSRLPRCRPPLASCDPLAAGSGRTRRQPPDPAGRSPLGRQGNVPRCRRCRHTAGSTGSCWEARPCVQLVLHVPVAQQSYVSIL